MSSVTNRIKDVKQPSGGYINPSAFKVETIEDGKVLGEENLHPSVLGMVVDYLTRKPLNNRLYPVSTQCLNRHLRLVKVISAQSSHYVSVFLLRFPKKGRLPLYQVVESFRPAMASAYRFAQANMAYSRFSFFLSPRYTVFL